MNKFFPFLSITAPPVLSDKHQLLISVSQMNSLQLDIDTKVSFLHQKIETLSSSGTDASHGFPSLLDDIKNLLKEFASLSDKILLLDVANIETRIEQFETFRRKQQKLITDIEIRLAEQKCSAASTASRNSSEGVKLKGIEMQKSKPPSFSGKTIDYPEFKRGWLKVPGVMWEDGNQVEQIKFYVDAHSRMLISRCNTMKEVWQTLDEEFAAEHEVISAVEEELLKLTSEDCSTPQYIVNLRNHLPTLVENLRSVNGVEHLCSPDRVRVLAARFDERTMYDWEYFRSKETGTTYERFFKFLLDRYESSRATIARLKTVDNITVKVNLLSTDSDCRKCRSWTAKEKIYTCPGCGRGTAVGEKVLHCLEHCGGYMKMSVNERSACVEAAGWCPVHLTGTHKLSDCTMTNDSRYVCGINNCKKHHHKTLHGCTTPFIASVNTTSTATNMPNSSAVLFAIQNVSTTSGNVTCLFDNCAECCLITKSAAKRLKLVGEPLNITVTTVAGEKTIESYAYTITFVDNDGKEHKVTIHEVEFISDALSKLSLLNVKDLFGVDVQSIWDRIDNRPCGDIDVLLGENVSGLHPNDWVIQGNLRVKTSIFGSGYVLSGSHPSIKHQQIKWNENVAHIRSCSAKGSQFGINKISIKPMQEYFAQDALGVSPPRRCGNCMNCDDCGYRSHKLSHKELYEYLEIESRVHYVEDSQCFRVSYPFSEDPAILPNNKNQVIRIAERLERQLMKNGRLSNFNSEFDRMLSRGTLVELSQEEIDMWEGPVHYISLQHVQNDESPTTPDRIVGNSSLSDKRGISLNSITMKGPNTLSDQWDILCKWRSREVGFCTDISKAYHSLQTGEVEKHVRRVVWRYGVQGSPWKIFGFCTVSFGDRPAAAILEIALKKVASIHRNIDPEACERILKDRYVDDVASGGSPAQVSRLVGSEDEDFKCDGTLSTILSKGSFQLKAIVISGDTNPEKIAKLGSKVLGVGYDATSDRIYVDLSVRMKEDGGSKILLARDSLLDSHIRGWLTKSNILGIINSIYDPLGLSTPITIRLRVQFRNLFGTDSNLDWDDPIVSVDMQNIWLELIHMLVEAGRVSFPRSVTPSNAVGKPQLICFFDGSDVAYAATIYIRWTLTDGSIFVTLLTSKAHVTPLLRISTARSEMNGGVLLARLVLSALKSLVSVSHCPDRVWMIGDSECVLASLEKVNAAFGEYFGNRCGEILNLQALIEKICLVGNNGEWWHTESKHNGADRATRLDSNIADISEGSEWQNGPSYLKLPQSEWPLNRDFALRSDQHIPKGELLKRYRNLINKIEVVQKFGIHNFIDINTTNVWEVLIRKTQWFVTWPMLHSFFNKDLGGSAIACRALYAKTLWFRTVMDKTREAMKNGRLKELDIREREDGLLVIIGRAQTGLQNMYGTDYLPVIMADTKVAELVMVSAHWKDHSGLDITMAMSRMDAWIVNARKLAKVVVRGCLRCRFLRKKLVLQKMAVLPDLMQVPCRPFTNIGLDLCGPLTVKSMANKRATMKVWITIFVCLNTKAVSMELAPGYSTDDFLLAYETHLNVRGIPAFVYSDRGSQLVAAQKEVTTDATLPIY